MSVEIWAWVPVDVLLDLPLSLSGAILSGRGVFRTTDVPFDAREWKRDTSFYYWEGAFAQHLRGAQCIVLHTLPWVCPNVDCRKTRGREVQFRVRGAQTKSFSHLYLEQGSSCSCAHSGHLLSLHP